MLAIPKHRPVSNLDGTLTIGTIFIAGVQYVFRQAEILDP